jgi:hypothetical protein
MKAGDTESSGAALEFLVADLLSMDAHAQILALLQGESGDDRTRVIDRVLEEETDAGVVREAGKLVDAMPRDERAKREIPLLLARVRSFDLGPRDAVAQASIPKSWPRVWSGSRATWTPIAARGAGNPASRRHRESRSSRAVLGAPRSCAG